jgi:tRNA(Ile)-lysidine synthase
MSNRDDVFREVVAGQIGPGRHDRIGVAVSGGSDSLGLMVLLNDLAQDLNTRIFAVTVNHGLRAEAADEAAQVAQIAQSLSIPHDVLHWSPPKGAGNFHDQARRARYDLMAEWGAQKGISIIALGHTADDQAETFLMRLSRASGVDGLAAMKRDWRQGGLSFVRPVLDLRREDLRGVLRRRGISWVEDPSNDDPKYDRARARQAMTHLTPLGISTATLTQVADNLGSIRKALDWYSFTEAQKHVRIDAGDVVIYQSGLRILPDEITRRLLQHSLKWITGAEYPARGRAVELLAEGLRSGRGMTLGGCLITVNRGEIRITREARAASETAADPKDIWDNRWRMIAPPASLVGQNQTDPNTPITIRALGEAGITQCPNWRETGLPRTSLLVSPAAWQGHDLIAAPLAGEVRGWRAELIRSQEDFFTSILTH